MPSWGTGTSVLVRPTEKHTCCSVGLASLTRLVLPHRVGSPPVTEQLSKQLETHLHTVLEALRLRQPQEATVRLPAGLTDAQVRPNQACSSIVPWDQWPLSRHVPRGHLWQSTEDLVPEGRAYQFPHKYDSAHMNVEHNIIHVHACVVIATGEGA